MSEFSGKKILVTGASSGIGREVSIHLSMLGAKVVLIARDEYRLKETISLMSKSNKHKYFVYDLENINDISKLISLSVSFDGLKFDGMVYAAGVPAIYPLEILDYEKLEKTFKTNTFSYLETIKHISKKQNSNDNASIVYLSSILTKSYSKSQSAYIMSKTASVSLSKTLSHELIKRKIRINSVTVDSVKTKMVLQTQNIRKLNNEKDTEKLDDFMKLLDPKEVSNMIIFLLSNKAKYIVGEDYYIDGGTFK